MTATAGKRVVLNAALSASTWVLPLALSFVATPILLSALGHEAYGIYSVVMGFVGYSFTFGIGKAASKYVAEHRASGADDLASEALSATLWFSLLVGLAGVISIVAVAPRFVEEVLLIPASNVNEAKQGLLVAAGIIFFTMMSQVWSFTLQGLHRFDRYALITSLGSVVLNVGAIVLAWRGFDVVAILLWNLLTTILLGLLFLAAVRLSDDKFRITVRIRRCVRNAVLGYGGAIILSQVFGNVLLLIERTWITRNLGAEALTFYVVPMTLALFLHAFIGSIVFVLFPLVNERLGAPRSVAKIYLLATKFVIVLTAFAVPTSIVFGEQILTAWVGGAIAERSATLLTIHISTFGLLASVTVAWHIAESFGRAGVNVIFSLIWLVAGTILMFLLGAAYGLEGVAAARLIGCTAVIPLAVFIESRVLGSFSAAYWLKVVLRIAAAAGSCLALQILVSAWVEGLTAVLIGTIVGGTAYVLVLLASRYFEEAELDWFRRSIRNSAPLLP